MALINEARQAVIAKAILQTLAASDGEMRSSDIVASIMATLTLSPQELHLYDSGPTRFEVYLRFISTSLVKADLIRKSKGSWYITDEGRSHVAMDSDQLYKIVLDRYYAWRNAQPDKTEEPPEAPELSLETEFQIGLETAEETARNGIRDAIANLGAYEFQDLVAALLRGMGYETPFIAPKGPDGGTDILAYLDPLGSKTPHIRVQVKHRKTERATNSEIASLQGNLKPGREIGLFVSSAGFTKEAERQMKQGHLHLELIDLERLIDLWIDHYGSLTDEDKARLPLRPVYFLAPGG